MYYTAYIFDFVLYYIGYIIARDIKPALTVVGHYSYRMATLLLQMNLNVSSHDDLISDQFPVAAMLNLSLVLP